MMTVGYGDAVPVTTAGKAVAGVEMLASLLVLALPIAVIGTNFTQVNMVACMCTWHVHSCSWCCAHSNNSGPNSHWVDVLASIAVLALPDGATAAGNCSRVQLYKQVQSAEAGHTAELS